MWGKHLKSGKVPAKCIDVEISSGDDEPPIKSEFPVLKKPKLEPPADEVAASAASTASITPPSTQPRMETSSPVLPSWLREVGEVTADDRDVEDKSEQVCDILKSNRLFDPLLQVKAPDPQEHDDDEEEDPLLREMQAAIEHGKATKKSPFHSRNNKLARLWDRSVKNDLLLARKYASVPKTHDAQAALKLEWLQGQYKDMKKTRISERSNVTEDACMGTYLNFPQLVAKLGGGGASKPPRTTSNRRKRPLDARKPIRGGHSWRGTTGSAW